MEMKFCCNKFQRDWEVDHVCGTNIRVIKVTDNPNIDHKYPYRFYITVGYEKGEKNVGRRMIDYCPYCGTFLDDFYSSEKYINENDDSFYTVD
jgi:hypothetical protein